tara:strand:+ start:1370 stop:1600 length:231 start_codon:yes stop_codon:yes gene_type:complete
MNEEAQTLILDRMISLENWISSSSQTLGGMCSELETARLADMSQDKVHDYSRMFYRMHLSLLQALQLIELSHTLDS